jgi:hypothetical protein
MNKGLALVSYTDLKPASLNHDVFKEANLNNGQKASK